LVELLTKLASLNCELYKVPGLIELTELELLLELLDDEVVDEVEYGDVLF